VASGTVWAGPQSGGTVEPNPSSAAPASVAASPEYVIGPGDTIQVFVWRSPELSVTVPVRPDGKISTPLVEDVVAVGKTPSQLAREMESVLSAYIRTPQVNIIVTNALSAFSHITVIGQVAKPQTVAYKEGMTVMDLLLAVGGLTDFAAGNRAKLIRKDPSGKDVEIKLHLRDLLRKGKMTDNVSVKPGDVLVVPETLF
jgi:polysaccharide export outer membrane protein